MRCLNKNQGFILLAVLLFMQIVILLNWCVLERVFLSRKSSKNFIKHEALHRITNLALEEVEATLEKKQPNCMISVMSTVELAHQSLAWWQSTACIGHLQGFHYYYVVEPLLVDNCAVLEKNKLTAMYFRITLFLLSELNDFQLLSQSTFIKAIVVKGQHKCVSLQHHVELGRQTWKELNE